MLNTDPFGSNFIYRFICSSFPTTFDWYRNKYMADIQIFGITGLQIRVHNIFFFLFLNQNICCGYSKEPSHWDGSIEHPKHMFKLMDKKIIAILRLQVLLNWPYDECAIYFIKWSEKCIFHEWPMANSWQNFEFSFCYIQFKVWQIFLR